MKPTVSLDELVVYAADQVIKADGDCTFERLVHECYTRFPEAFALRGYPHWPDSGRVNKSWHRCRTDRGWLVGSVKEGFRLTGAGQMVAERVQKEIAGGAATTSADDGTRGRDRYGALVRDARRDPLFVRFVANRPDFKVSEMEMRRFLGVTLETPVRILKQNLNAYRNAARLCEDDEVLELLTFCERMVSS